MPIIGFPQVLEKLLGVNFSQVDTVQQHAFGIEIDADDGTRRKYVKASGAIAVNDALVVDVAVGSYNLKTSSAALQPVAGVAPLAIAANSFGWVIVRGKATVKVAAAIVAGAHLVSTAVAGTLDDVAAAAADAQAAAAGIGVTAVVDDVPSAGLATVILS